MMRAWRERLRDTLPHKGTSVGDAPTGATYPFGALSSCSVSGTYLSSSGWPTMLSCSYGTDRATIAVAGPVWLQLAARWEMLSEAELARLRLVPLRVVLQEGEHGVQQCFALVGFEGRLGMRRSGQDQRFIAIARRLGGHRL